MIDVQNGINITLECLVRQLEEINGRLDSEFKDIAADMMPDTLERELGWEVGELNRAWQS